MKELTQIYADAFHKCNWFLKCCFIFMFPFYLVVFGIIALIENMVNKDMNND